MTGPATRSAIDLVETEFARLADPEKAASMASYLKTDMPFYGVQKPARMAVFRRLKKEFAPSDRGEYEDLVTGLWNLTHREEKYLAQDVAFGFREFIVPRTLPMYRRFIVEGAWWDLVDETATHMIRELVLTHPNPTWPVVDPWIDDEDMWLRRSALICQVGAKERTDTDRLFRFCEHQMADKEFFIRKAIGWALREYAKTDGQAVADFVTKHRDTLSGLSYREATKHIGQLLHC